MKWLLKPLQWLYCIYALILFLVLMVPVFLFSFCVSFLGRIKGGNLIYKACRLWAGIWFAFLFIRQKNIYEQKLVRGRSYIFVANHISYLDAPVIVKTFRHPLRPLGKAEMARVPVFGFIYKRAIVIVNRRSPSHRAKSVRILKSILRRGISILVFPEGTFNETHQPLKEFYNGAFRIAIETQTPIKPVLFLDAYKRLHYKSLFSLTPGINRSVFLAEVDTKGLTLKDLPALKDKVYKMMEAKLIEYKASWIMEQELIQ
jgi:1-acyl-sn-glycerol-3-phosphate acyltransferase